MERKYKVRLNSTDKIEELLQEIYEESCKLINQIQLEIDKLQNNTNLGAEGVTIDEKAKYAKAINDFVNAKKKAIDSKFEIAKFMGELVKHSGNISDTLNDSAFSKDTKSNLSLLKNAAFETDDGTDDYDNYNLKK